MTKEEALKILRKDSLSNLVDYYSSEELQDAIDTIVSTPSIPSDLDEAAEDCIQGLIPEAELPATTPFALEYVIEMLYKTFKAGAEWMAGQGITLEGRASRKYENGLAGFVSWILFDQQKAAHLLVNQGEEADIIINIHKK